jgi:ribosomal protein L11 methylase PrmA
MVLSGILDHQAQGVIDAAQSNGMTHVSTHQIADWVAILLKK